MKRAKIYIDDWFCKLINRLIKNRSKWLDLIDHSFLSADLKEAYKNLVCERVGRIS